MDLAHPLRVITPTLDGDILTLLAQGEVSFTGRDIARRTDASQEGVRQTLARLVRQGIVHRRQAGKAHFYELNRQHLAAKCVELLATIRVELIRILKERIGGWRIPPSGALLFGSTARGDADERSDIDLLVIRQTRIAPDAPGWLEQISDLEAEVTGLTGNDTRIIEYGEDELRGIASSERVLAAAISEGLLLCGKLPPLHVKPKVRRRK